MPQMRLASAAGSLTTRQSRCLGIWKTFLETSVTLASLARLQGCPLLGAADVPRLHVVREGHRPQLCLVVGGNHRLCDHRFFALHHDDDLVVIQADLSDDGEILAECRQTFGRETIDLDHECAVALCPFELDARVDCRAGSHLGTPFLPFLGGVVGLFVYTTQF